MELFDIYTGLMETLKIQRRKINGYFSKKEVTNETLDNLYDCLRSIINDVETHLVSSVAFDFSHAPDKCSFSMGPFVAETNETDLVERIMALSEADTEVREAGLKSLAIRDVEIVRYLPELIECYGMKERVPEPMHCFAILAYGYLRVTLDCLKIKSASLQADSQQIEYDPSMFFLFSEDEQRRNIVLASHHAFKVIDALERSYMLPLKEDSLGTLKAEIESEKNREKAFKRHKSTTYKRRRIIIDVYENGDYKDKYNKPNNKTYTATCILRHVNERCEKAGIPKLKDSPTAGVKTIIACIDQYRKKQSTH